MKAKFLVPLLLFFGLAGFLAFGLTLNPREVPSPLIDKPARISAWPASISPSRPSRSRK